MQVRGQKVLVGGPKIRCSRPQVEHVKAYMDAVSACAHACEGFERARVGVCALCCVIKHCV